jgi:hypothetical protein
VIVQPIQKVEVRDVAFAVARLSLRLRWVVAPTLNIEEVARQLGSHRGSRGGRRCVPLTKRRPRETGPSTHTSALPEAIVRLRLPAISSSWAK